MELWVYGARTDSVPRSIPTGTGACYLRLNGWTGEIVLVKVHIAQIVVSTTGVPTTSWHHGVATKNGATVKLCIDAVDVTGPVTNATLVDTTDLLSFGSEQFGGSSTEFFNGSLDKVCAVYQRRPRCSDRGECHFDAAGGGGIGFGFSTAATGSSRGRRPGHRHQRRRLRLRHAATGRSAAAGRRGQPDYQRCHVLAGCQRTHRYRRLTVRRRGTAQDSGGTNHFTSGTAGSLSTQVTGVITHGNTVLPPSTRAVRPMAHLLSLAFGDGPFSIGTWVKRTRRGHRVPAGAGWSSGCAARSALASPYAVTSVSRPTASRRAAPYLGHTPTVNTSSPPG